ncbi:MAG: tryptophan synthase subunit beta [Methanothrix sp.]|jgi:tryptophan synthase beta chain|uniref:tryptophan synthase subunit beta n=1 Tax=Methanothrix sp. TaxID=90426 RepID=UPI00247D462F|nr:tryptophan synthase subunit beta [Methanothrix sp.]
MGEISCEVRFGRYGGRFVPETLVQPLLELAEAFERLRADPEFLRELSTLMRDFAGRPTPLYRAENLSRALGRDVYLKREDLLHGGAHKINNTLGQSLLAKYMKKKRLIAETGAGQHGVATAIVGALLGFETEIYMGEVDIERQRMNVFRMELLGARVIPVRSGSRTLKDAINEALRDWAASYESTHYLLGTVAGPHPYPSMVREFQRIIGDETRSQILAEEKRLPDTIVACVGGGSNAMGIFTPFIDDGVRLIAVEAGGRGPGRGDRSAEHGASLSLGEPGVLHGAMTKILQDPYGQILESYSIAAGLDYPGVGPELAHLVETGRVETAMASDKTAIMGFKALSKLEGIIPALESAHAVGYAIEHPERLGELSVINISGRGDKDLHTVMAYESV